MTKNKRSSRRRRKFLGSCPETLACCCCGAYTPFHANGFAAGPARKTPPPAKRRG